MSVYSDIESTFENVHGKKNEKKENVHEILVTEFTFGKTAMNWKLT